MRGGSELILTLLEGGTYLIFPLVKLILGPPVPDNYCSVPKLAPATCVNLPWTSILSMGIGGGGGGGAGRYCMLQKPHLAQPV